MFFWAQSWKGISIIPSGQYSHFKFFREHVKHDLDPYVCLFKTRDNPDALYNHSHDWLKHMQQHKPRQWRCATKSHGVLLFNDQSEYEEHTKTKHKNTGLQLAMLVDRSSRPSGPIFESCPLCRKSDISTGVEEHIAVHLRYLALKSLPFTEDGGDYDEGSDEAVIVSEETDRSSQGTIMGDPDYGAPLDFENTDMSPMSLDDNLIGASKSNPPSKTTPTRSLVKAPLTVDDGITYTLNEDCDEYIPKDCDDAGERKVDSLGYLQDGREYRCQTFCLPGRGPKLFILATECARCLGYRDSYLLFNKNPSLYKVIASQEEKTHLIEQNIIPFSFRSRQIGIVTARSIFRRFGSHAIVNGIQVRDDYWETKAMEQSVKEDDFAGGKNAVANADIIGQTDQKRKQRGTPNQQQPYPILSGPKKAKTNKSADTITPKQDPSKPDSTEYSAADVYSSGSRRRGNSAVSIWYCCNCMNGPNSSWHTVCVNCSHMNCANCMIM
jgi:Chromatin remodelling complex Rsc7/Swp82 subunit